MLTGEAFKNLEKKAKKLGVTSLGYSNRVNNKYFVEYDGKKKHFGSAKKDDFLIHGDEKKREKYLERVKKLKTKMGIILMNYPDIQIIGVLIFFGIKKLKVRNIK